MLALSDLTISALEKTFASVELRYEAGLVSSLDVYQAGQNLAMRTTERPDYRINREASLSALTFLIGDGPEAAPAIGRQILPAPPPFPDSLPANLLESLAWRFRRRQ